MARDTAFGERRQNTYSLLKERFYTPHGRRVAAGVWFAKNGVYATCRASAALHLGSERRQALEVVGICVRVCESVPQTWILVWSNNALIVMPAALVGPAMLSAVCLTARPGESMERTSIEVAFAAKTYMKLVKSSQRSQIRRNLRYVLLAIDGSNIEVEQSRSRSQWVSLATHCSSVSTGSQEHVYVPRRLSPSGCHRRGPP